MINNRKYLSLTQCQRRALQNILFVLCAVISFFTGNFIALIYVDPSSCDIKLCTEKIKQTSVETTNQWINEWEKNSIKKNTFLLILIMSAPTNYEHREAIRQTWRKEKRSDTLHYFIIGTLGLNEDTNNTITSEMKKFGDLLLLSNIKDSYKALTKKLLSSLVYANNNIQFRFLLKADDDTFVNLPQLHVKLKEVPYKQRLYWGFFDGRAKPKVKGKWKESEWLLCDYYLPYALGGGYVISSDLVTFIATNAKYLKLYSSEDISLATWLVPLAVHRVHDPLFDTEYLSRGCNNKYLVTHKQSTQLMREKHISLLKTGHLCTKEFKVRKSYIYNWDVPPSQCCIRNNSLVP